MKPETIKHHFQTAMEMESNFLSQQEKCSNNRDRLVFMLKQVLYDLNNHKICTLSGEQSYIFSKCVIFTCTFALVSQQTTSVPLTPTSSTGHSIL